MPKNKLAMVCMAPFFVYCIVVGLALIYMGYMLMFNVNTQLEAFYVSAFIMKIEPTSMEKLHLMGLSLIVIAIIYFALGASTFSFNRMAFSAISIFLIIWIIIGIVQTNPLIILLHSIFLALLILNYKSFTSS